MGIKEVLLSVMPPLTHSLSLSPAPAPLPPSQPAALSLGSRINGPRGLMAVLTTTNGGEEGGRAQVEESAQTFACTP